ncbi:MAG: hypothetical protein CMI18_10980 [Opitutaceae bacterium]|nr:hypothetical protein [Opitutaceae bacterium]
MSKIFELTSDGWVPYTYDAEKPVLLFSWRQPCENCLAIRTMVEELAEELSDRLSVIGLNFDQYQGLAVEFGIDRPESITLLDRGDKVAELIEPDSKAAIMALVDEHFSMD